MSDLNKQGIKRDIVRVHGHGNVQRARLVYTAAAAAENDVIYMGVIPAYSYVTDSRLVNAALGATNTLAMKLVDAAGVDIVGGGLATGVDASTAGSVSATLAPLWLTEDAYVVVVKTGLGSATGQIDALVDYEYVGI